MPDYSKAIVYKLCCKDPEITDIYIGSTCAKYKRKNDHKDRCNNPRKDNNFPVYQFIREHGGWDNWEFVPIEVYPCESKTELVIRERYWFEKLGATLNSRFPQRTDKEYREANREEIRKFKSKEEVCECGETFTHCHKARHERTDKHLLFIGKALNKYQCPCGSTIENNKQQIIRHEKNWKHQNYLKQLEQPEPNLIFVD